jgi:hypothetical protein
MQATRSGESQIQASSSVSLAKIAALSGNALAESYHRIRGQQFTDL